MAIPNYLRPQLSIRQLLDVTPDALLDRLNALVVGPNYHVEAYTASPSGEGEPYLTAGFTLDFPSADADEVLDEASVRVFAKELDLAIGSGNGTVPSLAEANVVQLTGTTVAAEGLQVGDAFISTHATNDGYRRKITGFRGQTIASSYAQDGESSANPSAQVSLSVTEVAPLHADFSVAGTGTFAGLAKGAMYGGKYGDKFTISVTTAGAPGTAVLQIRSATGLYNADAVPTTNNAGAYNINSSYFDGVTITLTKTGANRDLAVGDVIYFTLYGPYELISSGKLAVTDTGDGYTGTKDTTYLIKVTTGGASGAAKVQVTDSAGVDVVQSNITVTSGNAFNVGTKGLQATFSSLVSSAQGGLRKGDVYVIAATAESASTATFDKVVLDGPAIDITALADGAVTTWAARAGYTGEIKPKETNEAVPSWTTDGTVAGGVEMAASMAVKVTRDAGATYFSAVDNTGELFASYRAIVPPGATEGLLSFNGGDVTSQLGSGGLANVLAFGVQAALTGAQGRTVYALRTAGTSVADFENALKKVRNTDTVYAIAALSDDLAVHQAVAAHVDAMSAETVKNFRRAYASTNTDGVYAGMLKQSDATNYTATVSLLDGAYTKVYNADGGFVTNGISAGDLYRTNFAVDAFGDETYEEYVIDSVISDLELQLVTGPASAINPAIRFEIWKADSVANQKSLVKQRSTTLGNRRVPNVWCDRGTAVIDGVTTVVPNMFIAAEIAGLRSALYPQQGLTNTEIKTITAAPNMFLRYSQEDLDDVAAAGTFVITQDVEGGAVYVRHQLTSKTDKGALYYEDSVGTNLDAIAFGIKDILAGYIGKRNVNAETVAEIDSRLRLYLNKQVLTSPAKDIGPALIGYTESKNGNGVAVPLVAVDATFKDRINVSVDVIIPLPLNQIVVTLRGSTAV